MVGRSFILLFIFSATTLRATQSFQPRSRERTRSYLWCSIPAADPVDQLDPTTADEATLRSITFCNLPGDEEPDLLCDLLLELGACSASVVDADAGTTKESPIFSEPWRFSVWNRSNVTAHFPASVSIDACLQVLREHWNDIGDLSLVSTVPNRDWVVHVQSSWKPIIVANRFVLTFPWHGEEDVKKQIAHTRHKGHLIPLLLQGGIAFGTGEHSTTQLCMEWLVDNSGALKNTTVLDYGAGSGILGMAACALGASSAVGVDIDVDACRIANANAMANKLSLKCYLPHLSFTATDDESRSLLMKAHSHSIQDDNDLMLDPDVRQTFKVVVANILAAPLVELAPTLWGMTEPGGIIGLSGILPHQGDTVVEAFEASGFKDVSILKEKDGWVLIAGHRPP